MNQPIFLPRNLVPFRILRGQFGRFLLVGCFNTANGYASVLLLQMLLKSPFAANLLGYLLAGVIGYFAHSLFTFRAKVGLRMGAGYALVLALGYLANLIALHISLSLLPVPVAQLIAVSVFSIFCYLGQSRVVFS